MRLPVDEVAGSPLPRGPLQGPLRQDFVVESCRLVNVAAGYHSHNRFQAAGVEMEFVQHWDLQAPLRIFTVL